VVVVNKMDTASPDGIAAVLASVRRLNPKAVVVQADSPWSVEESERVRGARVLAVEDGPTLTHAEMAYGAAVKAAEALGAAELVDPRPYAVGTIRDTFEHYPRVGALLPAVGYGERQVRDLEETIRRTPCDLVLIGTPIDLRRLIQIDKPALRVRYELQERGTPDLPTVLARFR
jgi:predicted GTPase